MSCLCCYQFPVISQYDSDTSPNVWGVFPPTSNFQTQAGSPTIQPQSDTMVPGDRVWPPRLRALSYMTENSNHLITGLLALPATGPAPFWVGPNSCHIIRKNTLLVFMGQDIPRVSGTLSGNGDEDKPTFPTITPAPHPALETAPGLTVRRGCSGPGVPWPPHPLWAGVAQGLGVQGWCSAPDHGNLCSFLPAPPLPAGHFLFTI